MALDHVRDFFHYDAFMFDATDMSQTSVSLFFTRFITHFCAPVFVFLAGTSGFFVGQRRTKGSLAIWLFKRGFWLIFVELVIVEVGWMFKFNFELINLQVIWALGVCMLFLAGFIYLPKKLTIVLCVLGILIHNAFDSYMPQTDVMKNIWILMHQFSPAQFGRLNIFVAYPIIPWIFLMPLGYYFGGLYLPDVEVAFRRKRLIQMGTFIIVGFLILRTTNLYGDPKPWEVQKSIGLTIASFFNVFKYPPSLLYLMITTGPTLLFLALVENWKGKIPSRLIIIGRVPMFFYIVHVYVIHAFASLAAVLTGFKFSDMQIDIWVNDQAALQGYGFFLWTVYVIWVLLILGLYPVCRWYNNYKSNNRDKWWLSYL
jgi:uncharacterized membrane protein